MLIRHVPSHFYPAPEVNTLEKFTPKVKFKYFLSFPGEIRNQIYNLLLLPSLGAPKPVHFRRTIIGSYTLSTPEPIRPLNLRSQELSITAQPRWGNYPLIRIRNVGLLQILLVNKQMYEEVSTMLYSHARDLTVGGYILQHRDEDPTPRWKVMFEMLERRPGLLQSIRHLTIGMPSQREDMLKGHWRLLGFLRVPRERAIPRNLWKGIPDMVDFVGNFKRLEKVSIVVTVENSAALPNFGDLYKLFRCGGVVTEVEFVASVWDRNATMQGLERWNEAWRELLKQKEDEELKVAIQRSLMSCEP